MSRRLGRLSGFLAAFIVVGAAQLVAPAAANAGEIVCDAVDDPTDPNDEDLVYYCVSDDVNHQGFPRVHVTVGVPGTAEVSVTASVVTGHIPQQQELCLRTNNIFLQPEICVLPR